MWQAESTGYFGEGRRVGTAWSEPKACTSTACGSHSATPRLWQWLFSQRLSHPCHGWALHVWRTCQQNLHPSRYWFWVLPKAGSKLCHHRLGQKRFTRYVYVCFAKSWSKLMGIKFFLKMICHSNLYITVNMCWNIYSEKGVPRCYHIYYFSYINRSYYLIFYSKKSKST